VRQLFASAPTFLITRIPLGVVRAGLAGRVLVLLASRLFLGAFLVFIAAVLWLGHG
jgi:hypothetical protein